MRPVHSRSPCITEPRASTSSLFSMPETGNQYVSLDDGAPSGWFSSAMSHSRERTLLISLAVVSLVAIGLLFSTVYYANHSCPVTPVTPTTPTTTPSTPTTSTTHKPTTTSTTPSTTTSTTPGTTTSTEKQWSTTTTSTTSEPTGLPTSEEPTTKKHKTTSTSTSVPTTTEENTTFTTRKHKTKTTTASTESTPTEHPNSTRSPKGEEYTEYPIEENDFSGSRKKKSKHEQDFW